MKYAKVTRLVSLIAHQSLYKIEIFKENNMRKAGRLFRMKHRKRLNKNSFKIDESENKFRI